VTPADRDFYEVVSIGLMIPLACLLACYGVRWRRERPKPAEPTEVDPCRRDLLRRLAKGRPNE
jgi:hypothetical protein